MNLLATVLAGLASLYLVGGCIGAGITALRSGPTAARLQLAKSASMAMSLLVAVAALRSMRLESWNDVGFFASVFGIKLMLKGVLSTETKATVDSPS